MRGSATRSYGIEVASLAGLPSDVIARAKVLIKDLEDGKVDKPYTNIPQKTEKPPKNYKEIIDILNSCDINTTSPMVAFDTLSRLIELNKEN